MLLKLTRSTLGALNFSLLGLAPSVGERGERELFFFNFGSQDFQEWGIMERGRRRGGACLML
jgi:hypothetical protein